MDKQTRNYVDAFMADLIAKNPGEHEFHQAVSEVVESVAPMIMAYPYLREQKVMERMVEPEPRRGANQSRFPCADEQRHRSVQRRYPFPCEC